MEKAKSNLIKDGYVHIYEWTDEPNKEYEKHSHQGNVSFYVVRGNIEMSLEKFGTVNVIEGQKFDVPKGVLHTAKVGPNGCTYVVGEEIEGDS